MLELSTRYHRRYNVILNRGVFELISDINIKVDKNNHKKSLFVQTYNSSCIDFVMLKNKIQR